MSGEIGDVALRAVAAALAERSEELRETRAEADVELRDLRRELDRVTMLWRNAQSELLELRARMTKGGAP